MEREDEFAALYKKLLRGCFEPDPRRAEQTLRAVLGRLFPGTREPPENPLENRGAL